MLKADAQDEFAHGPSVVQALHRPMAALVVAAACVVLAFRTRDVSGLWFSLPALVIVTVVGARHVFASSVLLRASIIAIAPFWTIGWIGLGGSVMAPVIAPFVIWALWPRSLDRAPVVWRG